MRVALLLAVLPSRRLQLAALFLVLVTVVGVVGYMVIADLSLLDALYQTVTTLTTVGFREVKPFDTATKVFTIGLIVLGVGTFFFTLTVLIEEAMAGDFTTRVAQRRMEMEIERLENHAILCGFGRVGQEVAREFRDRGVPFVIIESNEEQVKLARSFGYLVVEGDAADERVLNQAGIARARVLLAASDSDAGNTYITLTAKAMNPNCYVVARVGYPHNEEKLKLAGADRVLSLYTLGGRRMVLSALQPLAADFMDTLAAGRHGDLVLAEFEVNPATNLAGRTCADLLRGTHNATLLGVRTSSGELIVGPRGDYVLQPGDIVIVLAEEQDIASMSQPAEERGERAGT